MRPHLRNGVHLTNIRLSGVNRRRQLIAQYGVSDYVRDAGVMVGKDDYGELWQASNGWDDEVVAVVHVVNATPEPDGTRREYWLRVPPSCRTAHEAVAWTFRKGAPTYAPAVQT